MKLTKSRNGHYYWQVTRVWQETFDHFHLPYWVGRFDDRAPIFVDDKTGQKDLLPSEVGPTIIKDLMEGRYLNRVQKNRIACFDQTFTLSKSVSIVCFGLTPPAAWNAWARMIDEKSRPVVEDYLRRLTIRQGAGGSVKIPAVGCAIGFVHYKNYYGDPHGHVHYAIPNMAVSRDGQLGAIGNLRDIMRESAMQRAMFQKGIDDALQSRGYKTKRVGNYVEVEGIPKKMITKLSTGRRAIESIKAKHGFDSSRAHDFYAREARRSVEGFDPTPQQMHERVIRMASRLGVGLDTLRRSPDTSAPTSATAASRSVAYDVSREALRSTVKLYGSFTRDQYLEQLYTLGIGRRTTTEDLKVMGESLLRKQVITMGPVPTQDHETMYRSVEKANRPKMSRHEAKDHEAPPSAKLADPGRPGPNAKRVRETSRQRRPAQPGEKLDRGSRTRERPDTARRSVRYATRSSARAQDRILKNHGFVKEAWNDLERSTKNLGKAIFMVTSRKAKAVIDRLGQWIDPPPSVQRLTLYDAQRMVRTHLPTHYLKAHAIAILKGLVSPGNPDQRAEFAEKIYAQLRSHQRLPRNTVLVIDPQVMNSPRLLHQITKIAKRDKATLVMTKLEAPQITVNRRVSHPRPIERSR